jgi:plasmid stabilization system protein ParE
MKVIYTDEALRDLDEILEFIELHYPAISVAFEERLRAIEQRIESWPKSAEEVAQRPWRSRGPVRPLSVPALLSHRRRRG